MNDLSAKALIGLQEARRFVFRDENDGSRDDLLIDAVNDVSASIWDHCRREFLSTASNQARIFQLASSGFIELSPYDLRNLISLVRYTDRIASLQETLTSDQYRLLPAGKSAGSTYLWIQIARPKLAELEPGFGWQVTVTGDWGMSTVPDSVKLACKQWVKNIVENPGAYASQSMAGYTVAPELEITLTAAGMPTAVRKRLEPWRRHALIR